MNQCSLTPSSIAMPQAGSCVLDRMGQTRTSHSAPLRINVCCCRKERPNREQVAKDETGQSPTCAQGVLGSRGTRRLDWKSAGPSQPTVFIKSSADRSIKTSNIVWLPQNWVVELPVYTSRVPGRKQ